ncbi:Metallo-hydrolase/oxidoreductase [Auriculariales sp. MPI-PUGE-AT-0066]|nr:Metallo-hydrolase/oxidoreductase [Auriculariales sp. MPI-PUGE-AT-0066]
MSSRFLRSRPLHRAAMSAAAVVSSSSPLPTKRASTAHHGKGAFINPWPSFTNHTAGDMFKMVRTGAMSMGTNSTPAEISKRIPVRMPTWGNEAAPSAIKSTWLGHACFLLEMPRDPAAHGERGVRVLFDPVFSHRCSPVQFMGPARFTEAPCKIEEIPEVDAIVISHNHYDHMDTHTLTTLFERPGPKPHIFAPLGNEAYFKSLGCIPNGHMHTLDWWGAAKVDTAHGTVDVHCTPCQHFTGRGIGDRFKTLWASWAIVAPGEHGKKVWFGGDTGYRSVPQGADEDKVPTCPAFKEIGEAFGGFDFAMIPIGAYEPRWFMSPIHCAPQDSVRVFQDIRAKRATGMHWGTWVLTTESIFEPPTKLREEAAKLGLEPGAFDACKEIGETVVVDA